MVFVLFPGRAGLCRKEGHFGSESIPPWPILSGCDSWMWNIYGMHAQTHNRDTDKRAPYRRTRCYMWSTTRQSSNSNVSSLMHRVSFFYPFLFFPLNLGNQAEVNSSSQISTIGAAA